MLIHDTHNVQISYNEKNYQIIQTWIEYIPSEEFKKAIDKTVEFSVDNRVDSIISDTRKQRVVKPEDADYAASMMPGLFETGLKAMAFVIPVDVFTKMSLYIFAKSGKSDNVEYFTDLDDAQNWIEKRISSLTE